MNKSIQPHRTLLIQKIVIVELMVDVPIYEHHAPSANTMDTASESLAQTRCMAVVSLVTLY